MRISLIGNIASGKSTLAEKLGGELKIPVFKEAADASPLFESFSLDRKKWSFEFHMSVLHERFANHFLCNSSTGVIDRTFWETKVFADVGYELNEMDDVQYSHFTRRFDDLEKFIVTMPMHFIFLNCKPEKCLERLKQRGREWEAKITLDYLSLLDQRYRTLFEEKIKRQSKVTSFDSSNLNEMQIYEKVLDAVKR